MNRDEIRNLFETAALGCLDIQKYSEFIKVVSLDEVLKNEYAKYQKIASIIPLSLKIENPPESTKNKVVIGIKKIILSKQKQLRDSLQQTLTEKISDVENEKIFKDINKPVEDILPQAVLNSIDQLENSTKDLETINNLEKNKDNNVNLKDELSAYSRTDSSEVKINLNYSSAFKEEIVDEVTKKVKKTISIYFEEFQNKIDKKNKFSNLLLVIITLLVMFLIAINLYQILTPTEKPIERKIELKKPLEQKQDSL